MTEDVKKPPRFPKMVRAWAAFVALGLGGALGAAGCDSKDDPACETDAQCGSGRCFQEECRPPCEQDQDCHGGLVCREVGFTDGTNPHLCVFVAGAGSGGSGASSGVGGEGGNAAPSGRYTDCEGDDECDAAHGFACIDGLCSYECRSHADCADVGHCDSRVLDGVRKNYCVVDETPPEPGKLYTACPQGDECSEAPLCVGAGPGDLDAYCTVDCSSDDECAAGYFCGRIIRPPCEDACEGSQMELGNAKDPRCAPADQIGPGLPYQCSDEGVMRRVCRAREFCNECQSDADCLATPNQVCAKDESGAKICTRLCDTGARSCPWGNAARCAVFDDDLGVPTCSHRFGSCTADGETCQPCLDDSDCPGGACAVSSFTGEHWCVDFRVSCECAKKDASGACTNGGCPDSPGGLTVMCVDDDADRIPNGYCYAANSTSDTELGASPQTGCWDPP